MKKTTTVLLEDIPGGKSSWRARLILCLAVLVAYAGAWTNEFVYDDRYLLVNNFFLRHWGSFFDLLTGTTMAGSGGDKVGFYRPVQMVLFFLVYQAFGLSTMAYHALNIILQALNACLLHRFGISAGFKKSVAFTAALLWALHPLQTSDVSYVSSVPELLWSCFCLLGLITLLPDFTPRKTGLAMIFFMLALGCKESAVVFPALATALFFFTNKDRAKIRAYLKLWPLWLVSIVYIGLWVTFMHRTGYSMDKTGDAVFFQAYTGNFINRALTFFATLPVYVRLIIWPASLHIERNFPVYSTLQWYPLAGMGMIILALIQIFRKGGRALSFGLLWFAIALSPYSNIAIPIDAKISEGWLYMPAMGLFLGMTQTAAGFFGKKKNAARLLVCFLALLLGTATFIQNEVWRNNQTLWQGTLDNGGYVDRLSYHAGIFNLSHHQYERAAAQFQILLDHPDGRGRYWSADVHMLRALALLQPDLDENNVTTVEALAAALPSSPHIDAAITEFNGVLRDDPDSYWAHKYLAAVYRYRNDTATAGFHEQAAAEILRKQANPR